MAAGGISSDARTGEVTARCSSDDLPRMVRAVRAIAAVSRDDRDEGDARGAFPKLLAITAAALACPASSIYVIDEQTGDLVLAGAHPQLDEERRLRLRITHGLVGEAIANPFARAFDAAELGSHAPISPKDAGHLVVAPLRANGRVIGTLHLARPPDRPFDDSDMRLAEVVADQVALHVHAAKLDAAGRARAEALRIGTEIGRAIAAAPGLDRVLELSCEALTRIVDGSNAFILLVDPERQIMLGRATSNVEHREQFRTVEIPLQAPSIAARALRNKRPMSVSDARAAVEVSKRLVELYGEQSILALPLLVRDEPVGAIVIDDTRAKRAWAPAEIERAELIAHQVAVAISNARLYEDLRQSHGELGRAQDALVNRERLAALGQLAATVAHEVRNPVGVLFNSLGTLSKMIQPTGDVGVLLRIMQEETDRLNHLVGDLLDFARPMEPALGLEPLDGVVHDAVEAVQNDPAGAGIDIRIDLADDLPSVPLDARMIRRALLNLLLNGAQAMASGGALVVRAHAESHGGRRVARIDVIDSGTGIAAEVAARMFEPFFTTKASGTGLGLAVVKSIALAHRGEVSFQSSPDRGTTFTLRLPLIRETSPPMAGW